MYGQRFTAFLLIVIGMMILAYGGFTYTKKSHGANISSLPRSLDKKTDENMPVWLGIGALAMGGMLGVGKKYNKTAKKKIT